MAAKPTAIPESRALGIRVVPSFRFFGIWIAGFRV